MFQNSKLGKYQIKVLHITPMYPTEQAPGRGTFIKSQIDSLKKYASIDLLVLPGFGGIFPYLKFISTIWKYLRKDYHLVHVHYGNAATLIKILNMGRKPIITSYCGSDLLGSYIDSTKQSFKSKFFKKLNIFFSRFDTYSIVKSENLKEKIKGKSKNIEIIPNGVDINFFKPENKIRIREQLSIGVNEKVILFPADSYDPTKNFLLLKNAVSKIPDSNYKIITFERKKIPHKDVPLYMNAADLVVCTSLHEGSPNILKEAMACNCIIYSTDCGDVKYLIEGVVNSKIIPFDVNAWAKEINNFFLQKSESTNLSKAREVLIQKQLDLDSIAQKIFFIYKKIYERHNLGGFR